MADLAKKPVPKSQRPRLRREKVFRDRHNPLEVLTETELLQKYRFPRWAILQLTDLINQSIAHPSGRSGAVPALLQVCLTLKYLAGGSFQDAVGENLGLHQTTVSRTLHRVLDALVELGPRYIRKPSQEEAQMQKQMFRNIAGIPDVFAAIDCIHAACDANMMFIDCISRYPGSVPDAHILHESGLYRAMERQPRDINGIILGDSSYPIREWLLTPFQMPQDIMEANFNSAHEMTRDVIRKSFTLLKKRFRSLQTGYRLDPETACKAIYSCFVLHNIALTWKIPLLEDANQEVDTALDMPDLPYQMTGFEDEQERTKTEAGMFLRCQIARGFFQ
ncbi:hypothetical protein EGW08_008640 [Elysia chlorotica]|uniref:Putative nuclease HARBI1 n=1 Tax=Elysia chlorotica TaxID=188477 RepID=A0A3S0ZV21_ELYCH|nr:hypothetical protein EGW08_008640 [Elysia chlorotica]